MKKYVLLAASLFAVSAVQAAVVPVDVGLVNGDFESYTPVGAAPAPGGVQVRGLTPGEFWDASGNFTTLDGWSEGAGSTWADSGTEKGGYNPTGTRNLYLMGEDGVAEQTTSWTIGSYQGADEWYHVSMLMGDIWEWAYAEISLYYDDPANVFATKTIYSDFAGTGWWSTMSQLDWYVPSTLASQGGQLGISIRNAGDIYLPDPGINGTWMAVDNVSIEAIPEPATMGLVGIFGAGLLFARRILKI